MYSSVAFGRPVKLKLMIHLKLAGNLFISTLMLAERHRLIWLKSVLFPMVFNLHVSFKIHPLQFQRLVDFMLLENSNQ